MIFKEIQRGEAFSAHGTLDLALKTAKGGFHVPIRYVEDELNIGPADASVLSYGQGLNLMDLGPAAFRTLGPASIDRGFRLANTGGVYIHRRADLYLCMSLDRLPSVDGSVGGVAARYRLFDTSDGPDGLESLDAVPTNPLVAAIDDALDALGQVSPFEKAPFGMGDNAPPPNAALNAEEYAALLATLHRLRPQAVFDTISREDAELVGAALSDSAKHIAAWVGKRIGLVEEGFYRGVGTAAATGMVGTGLWLIAGGKLSTVSNLLLAFAGQLLGR